MDALLLHCCVEISPFYRFFLVEIKDFVLDCLRCCFKDICSLILTFSLNWREYKFLSFFITTFLQITPTI